MDIRYIHLYFKLQANPAKRFPPRAFKKTEISINTIRLGEGQINKQAKCHPYAVTYSYISSSMHIHQTASDQDGFKEKSINTINPGENKYHFHICENK